MKIMKFKLSRILLNTLLALILMFSLSSTAFAALDNYTVLVPLPGTTLQDNCTGTDCKATFQSYLPGAFKLAISISAVLAFVMITYGGFLYATTDAINGKETGRSYIENAVYGLILVIGAWAILNTISPEMLKFNLNLPVPSLGTTTSSVTSTSNANGLQDVTVAALADLTTRCAGCTINITSTTGGSHDVNSKHYQGLAVDIAPNTQLTNYLTGSASSPAACTRVYKTLGGVTSTFLWEPKGYKCDGAVASDGDHWHMSVTP